MSLFKGYSLVYCEETRRWYRRDNGQWTEDILMLPEWGDIQGEPPNFPGGASAWGDITGTLADQTDLQTALDGKAPTHTHPYASDSHNHDASYAPVSHTHSTADVTGLDTALAGKASTGHNHDASYAAIGHNHAGTYEPANANIQTHVASPHAPANAQKNSDILKSEIEAVLTGAITSHSHSAGAISYANGTLTAGDVTMTNANTFYSGTSISLAAGTWLITGHITVGRANTTLIRYTGRIRNVTGAADLASTQMTQPSQNPHYVNMAMSTIVTLGALSTIQIEAAATTGSCLIKRACADNAAGNNATQINAIRLA